MKVKFDFKEPLYASQGVKKDELALLIKNKSIFRSKLHGRPIPPDGKSLLWQPISRQLPKGVKEENIQSSSNQCDNSFLALTIVQLST